MTETNTIITSAVDAAIEFSNKNLRGLIHTVHHIPNYMLDKTKETGSSEWSYWKPIKADIQATDILNYEETVGIKLPKSYIQFLTYLYFIELNFGHDIEFFKHTRQWIPDNLDIINRWGHDKTTNKGFLPFANSTDLGIVCFNSNNPYPDNEFDIILLTRQDIDTPQIIHRGRFSFVELLIEMTQTLNKWKLSKQNGG